MPEPLRFDMILPNGEPLRFDMGPDFVFDGNVPEYLYPKKAMPNDNRISAVLSDADKAAILAAVAIIRSKLPFLAALTDKERHELVKMGDKSVGYDQKVAAYMLSNPEFIPAFVSAAETAKDRALRLPLVEVFAALGPLAHDVESTLMLAGHEIMVADNAYYANTKFSAAHNVPGAQAIYDDLRSRYPGRGGGTPPAPPTPPGP